MLNKMKYWAYPFWFVAHVIELMFNRCRKYRVDFVPTDTEYIYTFTFYIER